ncbi:hypothetical protein J7K27_04120 [Candidatus Bathyarchaeota archaeon]|nr:hypothetical protein [Candidatus Bathyarchaeota archaeon]
MPAKKTITLKLDENLWKKAKIVLIEKGSSFQQFLCNQLKRLVEENKKEVDKHGSGTI